MKRLVVAAALVAAALPVTARAAAPAAPAGPAAPAAAARPPLAQARRAWAERYRANAGGLPVEPLVAAVEERAALGEAFDFAMLLPAGDLDGDRLDDVADLRWHETFDDVSGYSATVRMDVRHGRTGAAMWSLDLPGEYPYVVFAPVGADGRNGVVSVGVTGARQDVFVAGGEAGLGTVTAYDASGARVWEVTEAVTSSWSVAGLATSYTWFDDDGDLVPGGGRDYVLDTTTAAGAGPGGRSLARVRVLDGATGEVRDLGAPFVNDRLDVYPVAVPDVTGDKRDDVALVSQDGGVATLRVLSSADGTEARAVEVEPADIHFVRALPDVTGDGRPDAAVERITYDGERTVSLVDLAAKRVVWEREGRGAYPIGDVDRRRGSEVVVVSTFDEDPKRLGVRLTAYGAAGGARWSVTRALSLAGFEEGFGYVATAPVGDTNGDRVEEVRYRLFLQRFDGKPSRHDGGVVDGRTARVRRDPADDMVSTALPVDGRGTDALAAAVTNGVLSVTAWRGDAAARLWQTTFTVGRGTELETAEVGHLDRDRCAEVLVSTGDGTRSTSMVLSGATGAPLWVLTRDGQAAGVVSRPRARSVKRFVRTC
ncbi:MAG TPA: hypothetical protein VF519_14485 [Mycobacteriales bacterium]|jgi:hypothetical protein